MNLEQNSTKGQSETPPGGLERAFVVFVLLLSTGAFMNLLPSQESTLEGPAGNVGMRLLWAAVYMGIVLLLVTYCKGFVRTLVREPWLLALLVLAFLSVAWSGAPGLTLRRGIALLGTYLTGVYFVMRYDLRTQLRLLSWALGLAAIMSIPFGLLGLGICANSMPGTGEGWCGVYVQKNDLGASMVLAFVVFLLMARSEPKHKWGMRLLAAVSLSLLLLSNSKTSMVALLVLLLALPYSRLLRGSTSRAVKASIFAITAGGVAAYWAFHHLGDLMAMLGRNITLTGRLQLWVVSYVMALRNPWLGYGYNAFWRGYAGPSAMVWHAVGWHAYYAHDGLLELWLDVGLVGVIIFAIGFVVYTGRAFRFLRSDRGAEFAWPLMFLILMILMNVTESTLLAPNNLSWLLYVAIALLVSPSFSRKAQGVSPATRIENG